MGFPRNTVAIIVLGAIALLALLTIYNPMHLGFLTTVEVTNRGPHPVRLALLGVNEGGGIGPLHEVHSRFFPWWKKARFVELAPGDDSVFVYDWDDINFCWIAVKESDGSIRVQESGMPAASCPPSGERGQCCSTASTDSFVLDDPAALPLAPSAVEAAAKEIP